MSNESASPESMTARRVGRLETVDIRSVWAQEEQFSSWLAENLGDLAAAVDIQGLDAVETEHSVGAFSLDILAQTDEERLVAIENQFTQSDHDHLGKCLTYAAGIEAWAVIWVAPTFREEHRAAVDYFNLHSDSDVHFFAVTIRLVRIGDSQPAPLFEVVARPNDWQKATREAVPYAKRLRSYGEYESLLRAECGDTVAVAVKKVRDRTVELGAEDAFSAKTWYPVWDRTETQGGRVWPFGVYAGTSTSYPHGSISVPYKDLATRAPFTDTEKLDEFRERFVGIPGFESLPAISDAKYPSVRVDSMCDPEAIEMLFEVLKWFADLVVVDGADAK